MKVPEWHDNHQRGRIAAGVLGLALGFGGTQLAMDVVLTTEPTASIEGSALHLVEPSGAMPATAASYRNCAAVKAAGAAPIRRGQPGYGPHLDGDNDGIACE